MTQPAESPTVWTGRASDLLAILTAEARSAASGIWTQREMRSGIRVSLQLLGDGRRLVRLSREDRPASVAGFDRWQAEVDILIQHLRIAAFVDVAPPRLERGICRVFEERLVTE